MPTRVTITTRGPYLGRKGTLIHAREGAQYHIIRLDGDDRDRGFKPSEYQTDKEKRP
jgi:hypothetical protein